MSDLHKMTREQLFSVEDCMLDLLREISKMTTGREEAEQMIFSHTPKWFVEDLKQVRIHNLLRYIIYHLFLPLISQWLDDEASYEFIWGTGTQANDEPLHACRRGLFHAPRAQQRSSMLFGLWHSRQPSRKSLSLSLQWPES